MAKALQAVVIWVVALFAASLIWPAVLRLPQVWMVVGMGILTNTLQPSYKPFEGSRTAEDRGTAAQILWTVYLTQAAALVELIWRKPPDLPTAGAALVAMVAGLALRTWAVIRLGPWFTWNVTVQSGQQLVCDGPYRFLRHPAYTGALITFVAACIALRSWGAAALTAIALTFAFLRRIRHEERLLVTTLPGYEAYRARTGGLFPHVGYRSSRF